MQLSPLPAGCPGKRLLQGEGGGGAGSGRGRSARSRVDLQGPGCVSGCSVVKRALVSPRCPLCLPACEPHPRGREELGRLVQTSRLLQLQPDPGHLNCKVLGSPWLDWGWGSSQQEVTTFPMMCRAVGAQDAGQAQPRGPAQMGVGDCTLEARFSTRATMEFLKSVPAVRGRLVTSVMSCCPSGHIALRVGSELWTQVTSPGALWRAALAPALPLVSLVASASNLRLSAHQAGVRPECAKAFPASGPHAPVVHQPLEVLEEVVSVLVDEALH